MATDFSRVRHDPLLDWAGVQLKQGGVLLDADANELVAVVDRRLRALAGDVLGRATVSQTTPEAFRITAVAGDLEISPGRLYVDGLLAENHGRGGAEFDALMAEPRRADAQRYTTQPYFPSPPALPTSGRRIVYLDVWNREVTALERADLVDGAVGIDTSSRVQTVWQVRLLPGNVAAGATCADTDEREAWIDLTAPSEGRLTTGTFEVPAANDPCELPPTGGYRGLENQLYRVEIHDPGTPGGGATFKWSRENSSVGSRVNAFVSASELELETLGRDDVLGLASGDWVEIIDDVREFAQRPGEMRRIDIPDPGNRRIEFTPALPAEMLPPSFPNGVLPQQRNLRVRRWDQRGKVFRTGTGSTTVEAQDLDAAGSSGLINVPAAGVELILEHGLTVSFSSTGTRGFRRGDWWVVAARTADASVEALDAAPPRGTHHHFAKLGIWDVATGAVTDCRTPWPPEGGHDCGCTQCVTPESHASGQLTIQAAVDRLIDSGGTVCLKPGTYPLREPVRVAGARSITIRGQGPTTIVSSPASSAFAIESSMAVCIEKLAVAAGGRDSAITVRTALGLSLRELAISVIEGARDARAAAVSLSGLCAGVSIHDNLLIAADGIRTDTERDGRDLPFALLATVAIERNVFLCRRRGVSFDGTVAHMWDTRIAGNQFALCPDHGIVATGAALAGASLRIEANNLSVRGNGITCGVGSAWIERNRLHAVRSEDAKGGDAIALVAGLERDGAEQIHVLANQISGFTGDGIAIRMPLRSLIVKLNVVAGCGAGIVMSEDAESDSISIESNHVHDVVGSDAGGRAGVVAGILVVRTEAATVAGNQVRRIAHTTRGRPALSAGVMMTGVTRVRIHGNEVSEVGPATDFSGVAFGILVRAPLAHAEIAGNQVRRDDETQPDSARWTALQVVDADTSIGTRPTTVSHATDVSTVRLDDRRTLVLGIGRAYIATARLDSIGAVATTPATPGGTTGPSTTPGGTTVPSTTPAVIALVKRAAATIVGNTLTARGAAPAVEVRASGEIMFSDNRCELLDDAQNPAVRLASQVLILHANRVRSVTKPTIQITTKNVTAVGNITSHGIDPLAAPWITLNITG